MRTGLDMEKGEEGDPGETASQNFWALVQADDGQHPIPAWDAGGGEWGKASSLVQGLSAQLPSPKQQVGKERLHPRTHPAGR